MVVDDRRPLQQLCVDGMNAPLLKQSEGDLVWRSIGALAARIGDQSS